MPSLPPKKARPWMLPETERHHGSKEREELKSFYKTAEWRKLRLGFLRRNPLCVECGKKGLVVAGNIVDHIKPIRLGGEKLDPANLQTLCRDCHYSKSGREAHMKK